MSSYQLHPPSSHHTHSCSHCPHNSGHCTSNTCPQHSHVIQDYYWRDYIPNHIPYDAFEGPEGKYIGQVVINDCILPACIDPIRNHAIAEKNGLRIVSNNIKILCTPFPYKFYWEDVDFRCPNDFDSAYLSNIVKGGFQSKYNLYIGKAYHMGEWKIGKVVPKVMENVKGLQIWNQRGDRCPLGVWYRCSCERFAKLLSFFPLISLMIDKRSENLGDLGKILTWASSSRFREVLRTSTILLEKRTVELLKI
ncbi:hypothetical protein Trydic_g1490 [Trypoxylus dichotomus]